MGKEYAAVLEGAYAIRATLELSAKLVMTTSMAPLALHFVRQTSRVIRMGFATTEESACALTRSMASIATIALNGTLVLNASIIAIQLRIAAGMECVTCQASATVSLVSLVHLATRVYQIFMMTNALTFANQVQHVTETVYAT
jgi:hypothetical protein